LKIVGEAARARQKLTKNRSAWAIHEYFEPISNAPIAAQAVLQQHAKIYPRIQSSCYYASCL